MDICDATRSGSGPRHTRLALAVGFALTLSVGAGALAAQPGSAGASWIDAMDNMEQAPASPYGELEWFDDADVRGESINPFAGQDELIRAIASGEVDPGPRLDEFAAKGVDSETESNAGAPIVTATRLVTNCNDSGTGSLRDAVASSQNNDLIDLSQLSCAVITLESWLQIDQENLTLRGSMSGSPGTYLRLPIIEGEDGDPWGLITHTGSGQLTLEKITLQGGTKYLSSDSMGGCVQSMGVVDMTNVTITDCRAQTTGNKYALGGAVYGHRGIRMTRSRVSNSTAHSDTGRARGGGLYTRGTLEMAHSTVNNNHSVSPSGSTFAGGAMALSGANIDRSTISGNSATTTGGLWLQSGTSRIRLKNTTVSGNTSTGAGKSGGLFIQTPGEVYVGSSTFTGNITGGVSGPGMYIEAAEISLDSNIISGNKSVIGSTTHYRDAGFSVPPIGSHNLVGDLGPGSSPAPADTIQQIDTPLEPLSNNGGHTMTHAPKRGSWAFNHGTFVPEIIYCTPLYCVWDSVTDQTDAERIVGAGPDIGAFESDALFIGRFESKPLL